ncbi:hypothetical protein C7M84_001393 [Penaeus vannamei]|uniref:Uncharacterized protein n=1 Tax=Penaeus vannamei TaxID=6689 RepID=A0A423TTV5_PENVA|nr:hypothetical protein C7M84_001393 [Penaeus vannamei]
MSCLGRFEEQPSSSVLSSRQPELPHTASAVCSPQNPVSLPFFQSPSAWYSSRLDLPFLLVGQITTGRSYREVTDSRDPSTVCSSLFPPLTSAILLVYLIPCQTFPGQIAWLLNACYAAGRPQPPLTSPSSLLPTFPPTSLPCPSPRLSPPRLPPLLPLSLPYTSLPPVPSSLPPYPAFSLPSSLPPFPCHPLTCLPTSLPSPSLASPSVTSLILFPSPTSPASRFTITTPPACCLRALPPLPSLLQVCLLASFLSSPAPGFSWPTLRWPAVLPLPSPLALLPSFTCVFLYLLLLIPSFTPLIVPSVVKFSMSLSPLPHARSWRSSSRLPAIFPRVFTRRRPPPLGGHANWAGGADRGRGLKAPQPKRERGEARGFIAHRNDSAHALVSHSPTRGRVSHRTFFSIKPVDVIRWRSREGEKKVGEGVDTPPRRTSGKGFRVGKGEIGAPWIRGGTYGAARNQQQLSSQGEETERIRGLCAATRGVILSLFVCAGVRDGNNT